MIDARIAVGLPNHPKTKKLIRKAGTDGAWRLVCLILWVAQNRPNGDLSGLDADDIELAVDWPGDQGVFIKALLDVGFIDGEEFGYAMHDWHEHNPWAAGADARSEKARWLAACKHHGREKAAELMPEYAARLLRSATSTQVASCKDAASQQDAQNSSAPSPSPSPLPSPTPIVGEPAGSPDGDESPRAIKPVRKATPLPADFYPNETGVSYAEQRGVAMAVELQSFRNHHEAKGSTMKDWQAAWRTWCDKAVEFGRSAIGPTANGARASPRMTQAQEREHVSMVLTGRGGSGDEQRERDITGEAVRVA